MFENEKMNVLVYDVTDTFQRETIEKIESRFNLIITRITEIEDLELELDAKGRLSWRAVVIATDSNDSGTLKGFDDRLERLLKSIRYNSPFDPEIYLLLDKINPEADKFAREYGNIRIRGALSKSLRYYCICDRHNSIDHSQEFDGEIGYLFHNLRSFALYRNYVYLERRDDRSLKSLDKLAERGLLPEIIAYITYLNIYRKLCKQYDDVPLGPAIFELLDMSFFHIIDNLYSNDVIPWTVAEKCLHQVPQEEIEWFKVFPKRQALNARYIYTVCRDVIDDGVESPHYNIKELCAAQRKLLKLIDWAAEQYQKDITQTR